MDSLTDLAHKFLSLSSIAVVGISSSKQTVANVVYRKLKTAARTVYAVGKNSRSFDNDPCYSDLSSLPGPVQGVFIAVRPDNIGAVVDHCIALNIHMVWLHNMSGILNSDNVFGPALQKCSENNIVVIPGACPMMFVEQADLGHRFIRWFLTMTGKLKVHR